MKIRRLRRLAAILAGGPVVALLLVACAGSPRSLAESEASQFVADMIAASTALGGDDFCGQYAANRDFCDQSTTEAAGTASPSTDAEVACHERISSTSIAFRIMAPRLDGVSTVSEIEVIRTSDGLIRAVDPVYWLARRIAADDAVSSPDNASILGDCT